MERLDTEPTTTSHRVTQPDSTPRRTIASFERYEDAERLIARLDEELFPIERLTIVGRDLRLVERVTGRRSLWGVAGGGALAGAAGGACLALLFGLWFPGVAAAAVFLYWTGVVAVFGAFTAAFVHGLGGGRDFSSTAQLEADRYEVLADEGVADEAIRRLRTNA